jgi:hypothetical protein
MPTLAKLKPLHQALEAAGISLDDYQQDRSRPPTTMVGATPYVEKQAFDRFLRTLFTRAAFNGAGYTDHEQPRWCRPGVLPLPPAELLEEVKPAAADPEPAAP